MQNPLEVLEAKIDNVEQRVEQRVRVGMLREMAAIALSRLVTLDAAHATEYRLALQSFPSSL